MNASPLDALRDIHVPAAPDWWPPALGWWILLLVLLIGSGILGRWVYRRYDQWQQKRQVMRALADLCTMLEREGNAARFAGELSVLLRQVALSRFPSEQVAGLKGVSWLRFLDDSGGDGGFTDGPGQVLQSAPYQANAVVDVPALITLARDWLRKNA